MNYKVLQNKLLTINSAAHESRKVRKAEQLNIEDCKGKQLGLYKESYALVIGIDNDTKG
jgi:hypothetical protein